MKQSAWLGYTRAMTSQVFAASRVTRIPALGEAVLEVAAVAGAVAVGALVRLPLPFTPVPVTLQTLPVLLAGFAVGRQRATGGMLLYLALGLAGVPLFAATSGATFGYLLAFAAVPSVTLRFRSPAYGILAGTLVIYALGAMWLCLWTPVSPRFAVVAGILPFLPGDAVKAVAAFCSLRWVRR